jgi:hypothetical protein
MSSAEGYALKWTDEARAQLRGGLQDPLRPDLSHRQLSRRERIRLVARMHARLSRLPDAFRENPDNRNPDNPAELLWSMIVTGDNGDPLTFIFVVDDSGAEYGVLTIITIARDHG